MVLVLGVWGCDERTHENGTAVVNPPVRTGEMQVGELHNDVMRAFEKQAPLESIPSMSWDTWLETTLNSMEDVSATHDLPFNREETAQHIVELVKVFGALKQKTGIDPGMLRTSTTPEADMGRIIAQMEAWKMIDRKTAATLMEFRVDDRAGARAESVTDAALRDLFRIGASSREFWLIHDPRTPVQPSADPDDGTPCKRCNVGATISDFIGGMVGRIFCGTDLTCPAMMAAAASLIYNMVTGYCDDHPCGPINGWPLGWPE